MTPDQAIKDLEPERSFLDKFQQLSNPPETVHTIDSITDKEVEQIRIFLQEAGFDLNISEEAKTSLREHQIRNIDQGRGVGVVAVVGRERAQRLFDECELIAKKHNWTQRFLSGGLGIGLKHTVADIISLAVLPEDDRQRVVTNLNNRVLRGMGKIPKKPTQSTNPPESLMEVWHAMTSK